MRSFCARLLLCVCGLLLLLNSVRSHRQHTHKASAADTSSEETAPVPRVQTSRFLTFVTRLSSLNQRPLALTGSLLGLGLLLLPWAPATLMRQGASRHWIRLRSGSLFVAVVLLLAGYLFHQNALNVAAWHGRLAYGGLLALLLGTFLVHVFLSLRAGPGQESSEPLTAVARLSSLVFSFITGGLLLLFALEAGARAFPIRDSLAINPGTHFFWPDYYDARNSLGFNDREPGPKKGPRILVIGDSYCEGAGVPKSERFSAQLERLLGMEVFSAGMCGLDTFEEADVLDRVGAAVQPDIVIVGYVLNDAEGENPPSRRGPTFDERLFLHTLNSYAYYRAMNWKSRLMPAGTTDFWGELRRQHGDDSPGWQRVETGMDRIAAWCDRRGVRKVLVVFPLFTPKANGARDVMDKVERAARQRGFEARSTLDDFGGAWAELAVSEYDAHPGAGAHAVIARVLAEMISTRR